MELVSKIARNLDEPAKILGFTPIELAFTAILYAVLNMTLKGVPLASLLSFGFAASAAVAILILNRTYPQHHGLFFILQLIRPRVRWVSEFKGS